MLTPLSAPLVLWLGGLPPTLSSFSPLHLRSRPSHHAFRMPRDFRKGSCRRPPPRKCVRCSMILPAPPGASTCLRTPCPPPSTCNRPQTCWRTCRADFSPHALVVAAEYWFIRWPKERRKLAPAGWRYRRSPDAACRPASAAVGRSRWRLGVQLEVEHSKVDLAQHAHGRHDVLGADERLRSAAGRLSSLQVAGEALRTGWPVPVLQHL